MATESVKKNLQIEISAEGVAEVRRSMAVLSSAFNNFRRGGVGALAQVGAGFNTIRTSVGQALGVVAKIARSVSTLALTAGGLTFGKAILSAGALFKAINKVREATKAAMEEERRLTNNAAIFNIKPQDGRTQAAIMAAVEYAFTKIGAADKEEVKDMITPLIEKINEAIKGDTTALDQLGALGLSLADIQDRSGKMRSVEDIIEAIVRANEHANPADVLASLVPVFGDSDSQKFAQLIAGGLSQMRANKQELLELYDHTSTDIDISKRIHESLARESIAMANLGTSIKRGFGDTYAYVIEQKRGFIEGIRGDLEKFAVLMGRSYKRIMEGLFDEANKLTEALKGPSGSLVDGPLEGWLMRVEKIILNVVAAARGLVEYLATGRTDNAFITNMVAAFERALAAIKPFVKAMKELIAYVMDTVMPASRSLMNAIDEVSKSLGAGAVDWTKVGIVAGLILITGQMGNLIKLSVSIIGAIKGITGAALKMSGALAGAAASVPALAALAAGVGGGLLGKGIVDSAKSGQDLMTYIKTLDAELKARGKSEAEIAAYMKVAIDAYKDQHGESAVLKTFNLLERIPFLGKTITTEDDIHAYIDEQISNAIKDGRGASIEASRNAALADFGKVENKTDLVIDGVEVSRSFELALADLKKTMTIPVTLDIAGGLSRMANDDIRVGNMQGGLGPYFRTDEDPSTMRVKELVRVENLYIDGKDMGMVMLTPDAYEKIVANQSKSRRAR